MRKKANEAKESGSLNITDYLNENQLVYPARYKFLLDLINFKPFIAACNDHYFSFHKYDKQVSILTNELLEVISSKIALVNNVVYYKEESGHWSKIYNSNTHSLAQFFEILFLGFCESPRVCKAASNFAIDLIKYDQNANDIIQFEDCYLDTTGIHEGISNEIKPKHRVDRSIYKAIKNNECTSYSKAVDELLMHICNDDNDTHDRLLDDLSMIFVTNINLLPKLGRFPRLYGPTGENGKSTLASLLKRSIGLDNVGAFKTHQFEGYYVENALQYLIVIDDDEQGKRISEESSSNVKSTVTGGEIPVRQIRGEPYSVNPSVSLMSLSNALPKSEDKTAGFGRRLDWFYIENKLIKDNSWFDSLFSEESYQYLVEILVIRALDFITGKRKELSDESNQMKETAKLFRQNNASVVEFAEAYIDEYGKDWFVDRTIAKANDEYHIFCDENLLSPVGSQNFTKLLSEELNLVKARKQVSATKDKDDLELFKDSLPKEYTERLDGCYVTYLHSIGKDVTESELHQKAKDIINKKRVQAFTKK